MTVDGAHYRSNRRSFIEADILSAAASEFAIHGYRGTNLGNVAGRLGVTRQALYHYFPQKQNMLLALMLGYIDGLEQRVIAASASTSDPRERFLKMLGAHIAWVSSRPLHSTVFMHEEAHLPVAERERIVRMRLRHQDRFVKAYRRGVRSGDFAPLPEGLIVSILLGAGNWSYRWFNPDGRLTPDQFGEFAAQLLLAGFANQVTQLRTTEEGRRDPREAEFQGNTLRKEEP